MNSTIEHAVEEPERRPVERRRARWALLVLAPALLAVLAYVPRWRRIGEVQAETLALATPSVQVATPAPSKAGAGLVVPADIAPMVEAPLYARASGYVRRRLVDIGAHVEAGQLLAEIDTPELAQDLEKSRAELKQAEAALALARTTADRWAEAVKTASVTEQENAEKQADLALKSATLAAVKANVKRLEELVRFGKVTAPFAGTITARKIDVGELIAAGGSKELFRLAQTRTLRIFARVPQPMAPAIHVGQLAELSVSGQPGRSFAAKVVRTAGAISTDSRTLLVELEVDNSAGDILAGSFGQLRFPDLRGPATLTVPSSALLFRAEGPQLAVVGADGVVELRSVKVGRDFGQMLEIVSGVSGTDRVVAAPSDSLSTGTKVRIVTSKTPGQAP